MTPIFLWRSRARCAVLPPLAALLLAGCASFSPDGGFGAVEQLSRERIGQVPVQLGDTAQADAAAIRRMMDSLKQSGAFSVPRTALEEAERTPRPSRPRRA